MNLEVGASAPQINLNNAEETVVSLQDYLGKWVVLYFYPKDNTPGCTTEANDFTAAREEFEKLDCSILGVSPDSCLKHRNFIQKQNLQIELLADPNHEALEAYGVWQEKKNYGRTYMGVVRTTFLIDPTGKIAAIWEKVRVKGHVEAVLDKLKELSGKE